MNKFDLVASNSKWNDQLKNSISINTENLFSKVKYIQTLVKNPIGLLVGKIQSGKTGNLIGAAAHAIDQGYRLVIIYLSDTYALYEQNMLRVKEAFQTPDDSIVFVDNSSVNNDLSIFERSIGDIDFHLNQGRSFVVCTLKHNKRINNISSVFSQSKLINEKVLIIDDEGDDISQNTSKQKHKKIKDDTIFTPNNKAIVDLMSKFKNYVYLSVTATPQAPLLIYKFEQLSPNFCSLIYPGDGYTGLSTFHSGENPYLIEEIDDYKRLTEQTSGVPKSLKKALIYYLVTGYFRKKIEKTINPKFFHSFLIHVDKLIIKQNDIYSRVNTYIEKLNSESLLLKKSTKTIEMISIEKLIGEIRNEDSERFPEINEYSDAELLTLLMQLLTEVKLVLLNGEQEVKNLKRTIQGRNFFIVIGGDMLDRGLTIDGLAVSYFTRESKKSQADTLLQRARWYGYKQDYIRFCKLYTTKHIIDQFEAAYDHENSVWDFLEVYENTQYDLRSIQTYFQIDTGLLKPTSSAKAKPNIEPIERWFVQNYYSLNPLHQEENRQLIDEVFKANSTIDTYNSNFNNLKKIIDYKTLIDFISAFKFSEKQKKNLTKYVENLKRTYQDFDLLNFELVYLRYENGEERKVIQTPDGDYLSNIMQGRSQTSGDYKGDRGIVGKLPMLQIHKILLKSDSGLYKQGDVVYTMAFGLPENFILDNLVTSNMDSLS